MPSCPLPRSFSKGKYPAVIGHQAHHEPCLFAATSIGFLCRVLTQQLQLRWGLWVAAPMSLIHVAFVTCAIICFGGNKKPNRSTDGIFTYIWLMFMVNVGLYWHESRGKEERYAFDNFVVFLFGVERCVKRVKLINESICHVFVVCSVVFSHPICFAHFRSKWSKLALWKVMQILLLAGIGSDT